MARSGSERVREFRERQRAQVALEREASEREVRDRFGYAASETRSVEERNRVAERILRRSGAVTVDSRQRYMIQAESGARVTSRERNLDEHQTEERVQRALGYAAWRWEGFQRGEISSL